MDFLDASYHEMHMLGILILANLLGLAITPLFEYILLVSLMYTVYHDDKYFGPAGTTIQIKLVCFLTNLALLLTIGLILGLTLDLSGFKFSSPDDTDKLIQSMKAKAPVLTMITSFALTLVILRCLVTFCGLLYKFCSSLFVYFENTATAPDE